MKVTAAKVHELFAEAQHIVLTPHVHPDGDCLGAMLGLYFYLCQQGKKVDMLLDDIVPPYLFFLPGHENIFQPVSPVQADLLVVLDASDEERLGKVKETVKAPVLNIDHHVSNTAFADYLFLDTAASATSEIIYGLLRETKAVVSADMAVCLYTGIATDSGFFRYTNTSPQTMRFAAELMEAGAQPHKIAETLELRSVESLTTMADILKTLEFFADNQIAFLTASPEVLAKGSDHTEGLINYPRSIEGVEVSALFKVVDEQTVRISMRSKHVDVSKIALALGGGGHVRAAGCTFIGTISAAKEMIYKLAVRELENKE
ncbi:MAG: bifunctional oligoribonuclease/PAP phosphatase NrnA [Sporomusaceae bacterium]|nr:bifunctional oligoribonuclease/PAP phosphatase NrnA [Sporomusaceae bacterium]